MRISVLWVVALAACAPPKHRAPTASEPKGSPDSCVIDPKAEDTLCAPAYTIYADAKGDRAIAKIAWPYTRARWSDLPRVGRGNRAHVEVDAPIRITGWAPLAHRHFALRERVELAGDHVWLVPGAMVEIVGRVDDRRVLVMAETPFARPERIKATIACTAIGPARLPKATSGPPFAVATKKRIDLRSEPEGPAILSFEVAERNDGFVWIERAGDWVHIAGGQPPWLNTARYTPLLFDGWVAANQVKKLQRIETWASSGCEPPDGVDGCQGVRAARDAQVFVAPPHLTPTQPVGIIAKNTALDHAKRQGAFAVFDVPNRAIEPPDGQRFWIRASDVVADCEERDDDGCCPQ